MANKPDWLKQREDFKKRLEANQSLGEPAKEKIGIARQKLSIPSIFSFPQSRVEDDKKNKRMSSIEPYSKTNFDIVQSMSKSVDSLNRSGSERKTSGARIPENAKEFGNSKAVLNEMKSDTKGTENFKDIIDSKPTLQGKSLDVKPEHKNEDIKITKNSIPKSSETVNPNRKLIDSMVLDIKPYESRNSTPILLLPSPMSPLTKYFEQVSSTTAKSSQIGRKEQNTTESPGITKTSNNVLRKLSSVISQKHLNESSEAQNDQMSSEDIKSSNKIRKVSSTFSQTFSNDPKDQNTGISKNNNAIKRLPTKFPQKMAIELQDNLNKNNSSDIPLSATDDLNEIISSSMKCSLQSSSNEDNSKAITNSPDVRVTQLQKQTSNSYENVHIVKPPRKITQKLANISLDENQNPLNTVEDEVVLRKKDMTTPQTTSMCFDFTSKILNEFTSPTSPLLKSNSIKKRSAIRLEAPISLEVQEKKEVVKTNVEGHVDTINKIDMLLKENYDKAKNDVGVKSKGNLITSSYENVKLKNVIANDPEITILNNSELNNNLSCDPIYENFEIFRNHVPRIVNPTSAIKKLPVAQVRINFLSNSIKKCN